MDAGGSPPAGRRPLASREAAWARATARLLTRAGVSPNFISILSVVLAAAGAVALVLAPTRPSVLLSAAVYVAAAALIQLRLACNLLDGMVAIEGGAASPTGEIFNELPDRIADPLLLVAAGYAALAGGATPPPLAPALGWSAAALALLTAYVRALGASLGLDQDFSGPFAKPQRMAALSAASVAAAVLVKAGRDHLALVVVLWILVAGTLATLVRRVAHALRALEERG